MKRRRNAFHRIPFTFYGYQSRRYFIINIFRRMGLREANMRNGVAEILLCRMENTYQGNDTITNFAMEMRMDSSWQICAEKLNSETS